MAEEEKLLKEAKKLPWEERLAHKNWKVRVDANSDICGVCDGIGDPKDGRLRDFGPLFRKSIADSNASAQERALDAAIAYLKVVDAESARHGKEICDVVVVKCLTGRAKTVEKAQAVLLLWVELEATDAFFDAMEKAVKNRVAKAVVLAVDAVYQAVSQFGTRVVPPKRILRMLPELFDHQDQNVRAAAKGLTIELCRWIGRDAVKSILFEKMRDTMKKELEAEVDNVGSGSKPTRLIRSEQTKGFELEPTVEAIPNGDTDDGPGIPAPETDEYELVDPVDILTPLGKTQFWEGVKSSKWSERRDAVAELTRLASAKRLATGDYVEVSRMLKKMITDVNLAVAVEAVQAAGNLARGLRKDYSGGSRGLLPLLLERFKERKPVMVEAVMQTLQAMHSSGCFSLGDVVEEVKAATKNKVPSVRSQCLTWVGQCTEASSKATVAKMHKDYVPILMESLNDGAPEVRDAAFNAVAAIAKLVGMKPLEKSLEKLDDIKRKKLTDLIGGGAQQMPNGAPTSGVPRAAASNGNAANGGDESVVPGNRSAASLLSGARIPSQAAAKKVANGGKAKKGDGGGGVKQSKGGGADSHEEVTPFDVSVEDVEAQFTDHFEAEILANLKSSVWKERLEGILALQTKVECLPPNLDPLVVLIVRFVSVIPGWAEKNVQVQQKMMEILAFTAENSSSFSKRCVVLCLPFVVERVADVKTRSQATRCLTGFCEAVEPEFVVRRLLDAWKDHKNPKVVSEGLLWMMAAVEDFGAGHIPVKDLIDFSKDVALQSSAAPTRNAAVKVIGALHKTCGPDIKLYFTDVKPAVQTLVNAECEKNPFTGESLLPKRITRASTASRAAPGDALPREDISGKLTPGLMKNFTSVDWKLRQESIDAVGTILQEANMRVQPAGTLELLGALKARLSDSNKNLIIMALAILGKLAVALGPIFERSLKIVHMDVLKCLGDNKKLTREAAIKTLDAWLGVVPLGKLVPFVVPAILELKLCADGRKDIFDWLTKHVGRLDNQADVALLMKPIGSGVQDKNAEVRKAAESLYSELVKTCGQDMTSKATKSVQGPVHTLLLSLMDRCRVSGDATNGRELSSEESVKGPSAVKQLGGARNSSRGTAAPSRGSSVRASVTKLPKQEAAVAALDAAVQGQSLLNLKDCNKEEREKSMSRRTKFDELRVDQMQDVETDLAKYFREDIHRRMLSPDFRKQVEGVDILQKAIPDHFKSMIEVLDILLRWIVVRVCESNTICLLKVLDFMQDLFTALRNDGYSLTDWEGSNIFPCLVEKSGHNIEKVREKMRDLMRVLCCLYPPSKIFAYLTEGLRSKNNRTRIECVEHVGFLIERYGIEVGGPGKCLHGVVLLTTERDGDLRKASLQTLAVAYQILGEDVWKYLGKLNDMQRSLLDEKFKWKAREMDKKKEGRAGDFRLRGRLAEENGLDPQDYCGDSGISSRSGTPSLVSAPLQYGNSGNAGMQQGGPADWREAIIAIETATIAEKVVEGMKIICYELEQAVGDVEGGLLDEMAESADQLVRSLTARVSSTFTAGLSGSSTRACKYVLNTLMQTFQVKRLACEVQENTLHALITELLLWLLDDHVPLLDDGSQLLKALNVLMLKILENANRTSAFVVLIDLLHPSFGIAQSGVPHSAAESVLSSQRFSDLVVKCLIKLTKVLASTITEVDLDRLLQSIHECFQQLGLEEIRKRAGADDKPLRMVKTVLHELVKLRGTAIKGHLSMVPIDSEPQPIILAYIDLNLQTLAASRILAPTVTGSQVHWLDSGGNGSDSTPSSTAETQLKQELAAIFKKIGDKQTSTIGLYELYRITQLYPQVDIFSQLQNASMAFRTYIRDGLAQMEKSAATGRTPVTSSFVSPPPLGSSPGHVQPKISNANYHSEVNIMTNSFGSNGTNDADVGTVVMSSTEFDSSTHRKPAPQRYMETVSASPAAEVQGGTLNAIRERMKSIQAAAAGSAGTYNIHSSEVVTHSFRASDADHHQVEPVCDKALSGLQARMERLKSGVIDPAY